MSSVALNFKKYGSGGEPLIIIHGLFGSHSNWAWHCRRFAEHYTVYALDMRNHGASPHVPSMDYAAMAEDVVRFMAEQELDHAHVLGHSMGGKVAMQLALSKPSLVDRLIVADVAPVQYGGERGEHDEIFEGLCALQPESLETRNQADQQLAEWVEDEIVRQFLLSNLVRREAGGFQWRINLPVLKESYPALRDKPSAEGPFEGPVLFIRGDLSDYIKPEHKDAILKPFPKATVKTIMQTGHWLHAEKPETFHRLAADFLGD